MKVALQLFFSTCPTYTVSKDGRYLLVEFPLRKTLEEVATGVFEDARLNDEHAGDTCLYDIHC